MKLYWIEGPWRGKPAIVSRPRGGDWLDGDIHTLKQSSVHVLVSLLTSEEVAEFELGHEAEICRSNGLSFVSFPIPDLGIPASAATASRLIEELEDLLMKGKNVAVHCRQGIGRSSLIGAALLVAGGADADNAFSRVGAARGLAVPETEEQRNWVSSFASELAATRR